MITQREAYMLGYVPQIIGIYFKGAELFASVAHGATGELGQRVEERIAAFEQRQAGVIENVRFVERLLGKLGLPVGEPPRVPEEYHTWANDIFERVHAALRSPEYAQASAVHLLGHILGDATLTQNIAVFLHHFLDVSPAHAEMLGQKNELGESLAKAKKHLELAVLMPDLSEEAKQAAQPAVAILQGTPDLSGNNHASLVLKLRDDMHKLGQTISSVEMTLA